MNHVIRRLRQMYAKFSPAAIKERRVTKLLEAALTHARREYMVLPRHLEPPRKAAWAALEENLRFGVRFALLSSAPITAYQKELLRRLTSVREALLSIAMSKSDRHAWAAPWLISA